jgi:hypothetical protein
MFKRFSALMIIVLIGVVLLPGNSHPAAAGGLLSVWLYNSDTGQLVNVVPDQMGINSKTFPLDPGTSSYPSMVTTSRDGSLLAACVIDAGGNTSIRVYDLNGNLDQVAGYAHGPAMACSLDRYSFSGDNSQLVFGLLNHFPNQAGDTRPDWELIVMGVNDSSILYRLDSNSPLFPGGGQQYAGMLPFVSTFENGVIGFRPVLWATEGLPEYDSLVWNLGENSVVKTGLYGKVGLSILPGPNEAIWLEENDVFPKGIMMGPGYLFNVVMYSNKMGETYPIFTNASVLFNTIFIQEGHKIAVQTYNEPGPASWFYLDRDGAIGSLPVPPDVYELRGTDEGFVYLSSATQTTGNQLHRYRFDSGPAPQDLAIWSGQPGEFWRILWVTPFSGNPGLNAFLPILDSGNPGQLTIGGHAQVHTTEGDTLRVRVAPGFTTAVSFYLANGTTVTLLDGPMFSDGATWWAVETADGRTGWAVEGVMENGTYLQTLIPVP